VGQIPLQIRGESGSIFSATQQQKAEIAPGADPRAAERAKKAVITFSEFFDEKYLPHAKAHKRSWDRDVQLFRRILNVFGSKRLNEITRHPIQDFHSSVKVEGLSPARRRLLRSRSAVGSASLFHAARK
jgi:hypothetical protein